MLAPWIKFETTTPDKPEVVAMSAMLKKDPDLIVGKLLRLWAWADQNSVGGDDVTITEVWIDRFVNLRGFARALRAQGWLAGADLALNFPNFSRHNGDSAKRRAGEQRKKQAQRKRDICPDDKGTKKGPNGGLEEEEEEDKKERECASASAAEKIVGTYPRREGMAEALKIVAGQLAQGEDAEDMAAKVVTIAAVIRSLPSGGNNRYVPSAAKFFREKRWKDDPETFRRQGDTNTGQGQMSLEEAKKALGGRSQYLEL